MDSIEKAKLVEITQISKSSSAITIESKELSPQYTDVEQKRFRRKIDKYLLPL